MYGTVSEDEIDIFCEPARIIFAGCSSSGKTFLLTRLVQKYKDKFDTIISIGVTLPSIDGVRIVRDDGYDPFSEDSLVHSSMHSLIVFDDIMMEQNHMRNCSKLFVQGRHGYGETKAFSTIVLLQNLYCKNSNMRNLAINSTHVFLFRNRDLRQIQIFGQSFLMKKDLNSFMTLYNTVLAERFSYLVIDFTKNNTNVLCLRGQVAGEGYEIAYKL